MTLDDELQSLRRSLIAGVTGARSLLDRWHDRHEDLTPGVVRRVYDPMTARPVVLLVDASSTPPDSRIPDSPPRGYLTIRLPIVGFVPGMFQPVWVKKMDASPNTVQIEAAPGTEFEGGKRFWGGIAMRFQAIGPFVLVDEKTWVLI